MKKQSILTQILLHFMMILALTSCSSNMLMFSQSKSGSASSAQPGAFPNTPAFWQGSTEQIWNRLQYVSLRDLETAQNNAQDSNQRGWIELTLLNKRYSSNTPVLVRGLLLWRQQYPNHQANSLIPDNSALNQLLDTPPPRNIILLLPLQGQFAPSSHRIRDGFLSAYFDNAARMGKQSITFSDTTQNHDIAALYQNAVGRGAEFIVGPLTKNDVQTLSRSGVISVNTLALNYTQSFFSGPRNFYEFGLLPEDEAGQIAEKASQMGTSRALIIAPQNAWGDRMVSALKSHWRGSIVDSYYYTNKANFNEDIARLLHVDRQYDRALMKKSNNKTMLEQQRRQDFDVIFLFAQPTQAREIVPLLGFYYANNVPIYTTSEVFSGAPNAARDSDLNGVTICNTPWFFRHGQSGDASNMYALGRDAYLLSHEMTRLQFLPNFPIYGDTGALMIKGNEIHRRLPCATIRHGIASY